MLPHLSPLNGGLAGVPVQVPPPPRFRAVEGPITNIWLNKFHPFRITKGTNGSQKAGVLYESRTQDYLTELFGPKYLRNPAIHFQAGGAARTCIPDGLFLTAERTVIIEIKSQHMPEAWWQLRRLYEPVCRAYVPNTPITLVEICKVYDPHCPFPEQFDFVDDLRKFIADSKDGALGVFRWKP